MQIFFYLTLKINIFIFIEKKYILSQKNLRNEIGKGQTEMIKYLWWELSALKRSKIEEECKKTNTDSMNAK